GRSRTRTASWRASWKSPEARLEAMHAVLRVSGAVAWRGGDYDGWDLAVRGGFLGEARLRLGIEEQGGGCQMLRLRTWARMPASALVATGALVALGGSALAAGAMLVGGALLAVAAGALGLAASHSALAMAAFELARSAAESEAAIPAPAPAAPE